MVSVGEWGVVSYTDPKDVTRPLSMIASFADVDGRIFMYMMGDFYSVGSTLTISEASFGPTRNFSGAACGAEGDKDPEDPRCAKLSIEGSIAPCENDLVCTIGKQALFLRHPQMEDWPASHKFTVHELKPNDLWMIANYGGGVKINVEDYQSAILTHHQSLMHYGTKFIHLPEGRAVKTTGVESFKTKLESIKVPDWSMKVERSRWVVAHSLWSTVSTISVRLDGSAWGNIRSIVDGGTYEESSGKPVFYLPTPDPTNIDVERNPSITLTFSEAAIAERLDSEGRACGGLDSEDPLCARVLLSGKATRVTDGNELKILQMAFGERHPLAPWLAEGGSHTGGGYFTIEPNQIRILDYYGGATEVSVAEYLDWKVPQIERNQLRTSTQN